MFSAGVRAYYQASQLAAPAMIARRPGLIVNISFWAAQKHIGNVAYGISKAATDKMTADMATELKPYGVAVVSLYPGLVRTEMVMESAKMARPDQLRIPGVHRTGRGRPRGRS
jgi:NAD(P)-dependent dehydrogenase (short-subunit alcohol dehydrogenase family)